MNELQEQYRLLDVPADVSLSTLKQAYKDLVLVWHPDRFSDHPRLQKKAEEKLKCINLAYKELSALHRRTKAQQASRTTSSSTKEPHSSPGSQGSRHSQKNTQCKQHSKPQSTCSSQACHSDISLEQAQFILSHFHFREVQRANCDRKYFKSGPFRLELNFFDNKVLLENLCDSINGFHPILLTIPCKASGLFSDTDAQNLMKLFQHSQSG